MRSYAKKADGGDELETDNPALAKGDKLPVNYPVPVQLSEADQGAMSPETFIPEGVRQRIAPAAQNDVAALRAFPTLSREGSLASQSDTEPALYPTADPSTKITQGDIDRGTGVGMSAGVGPIAKATSMAKSVIGDIVKAALQEGKGPETSAIKGYTGTLADGTQVHGMTQKGAPLADEIVDNVLHASFQHAEAPDAIDYSLALKPYTNKDIAAAAGHVGLYKEELENLKSHLPYKAQQGVDYHYEKMYGEPKSASHQDYAQYDDDNYDVAAEYEKHLHEMGAHDQLINEGGIDHSYIPPHDPNKVPTAEMLHPELVPQDLEEKAARIGLPTTGFHGTGHGFSEFKLPEDLPAGKPEVGTHFGTLRAALDISMMGPTDAKYFEDFLKTHNDIYKRNEGLALQLPQGAPITGDYYHKYWNVIPAKIGVTNPLHMKDMGTWYPGRIAEALEQNPNFTHEEIQTALGSHNPDNINEYRSPQAVEAIKNLRKLIESKGYDSISYPNTAEDRGSLSYIIWNLEKARSFYAKFDPAHSNLKHIGSAIAGLSLLPMGIFGKRNQANASEDQMAKGGEVKKKHPQIDEDPQDHEFINFAKGGLIDSDIPGRTDKVPMKLKPGSYVLPADIPSALGEGNSKAGASILKNMFTSGPYGLPAPHIHSQTQHHSVHFAKSKARGGKVEAEKALPEDHQLGMKVPKGGSMCANCKYLSSPTTCGNKGFVQWNGEAKLPHPANEYCCDLYEHGAEKKADGGATEDGEDHVPIIAAGGEFIIHPDVVKHIGGGDMKKGHDILDKFVLHTRKQNISTLRKLKPPK